MVQFTDDFGDGWGGGWFEVLDMHGDSILKKASVTGSGGEVGFPTCQCRMTIVLHVDAGDPSAVWTLDPDDAGRYSNTYGPFTSAGDYVETIDVGIGGHTIQFEGGWDHAYEWQVVDMNGVVVAGPNRRVGDGAASFYVAECQAVASVTECSEGTIRVGDDCVPIASRVLALKVPVDAVWAVDSARPPLHFTI